MMHAAHIAQEDLALHAMQVLSPQEEDAVRLHLESCALCGVEFAKLTGDLALVAQAVKEHALPAGARDRFMRKIGAPGASASTQSKVVEIGRPRRRRRRTWAPWLAAAALVLISVSLGVEVVRLRTELEEISTLTSSLRQRNERAERVLELLTAPSAQRVVLTAATSKPLPSGRAVYLASRGALIFQASNLNPLPQNKTYELWVIPANGSRPIAAGLFKPDAAGNAAVVLPPIPAGVLAKAFGVTIEKAGGSDTPTLPIILSGAPASTGG